MNSLNRHSDHTYPPQSQNNTPQTKRSLDEQIAQQSRMRSYTVEPDEHPRSSARERHYRSTGKNDVRVTRRKTRELATAPYPQHQSRHGRLCSELTRSLQHLGNIERSELTQRQEQLFSECRKHAIKLLQSLPDATIRIDRETRRALSQFAIVAGKAKQFETLLTFTEQLLRELDSTHYSDFEKEQLWAAIGSCFGGLIKQNFFKHTSARLQSKLQTLFLKTEGQCLRWMPPTKVLDTIRLLSKKAIEDKDWKAVRQITDTFSYQDVIDLKDDALSGQSFANNKLEAQLYYLVIATACETMSTKDVDIEFSKVSTEVDKLADKHRLDTQHLNRTTLVCRSEVNSLDRDYSEEGLERTRALQHSLKHHRPHHTDPKFWDFLLVDAINKEVEIMIKLDDFTELEEKLQTAQEIEKKYGKVSAKTETIKCRVARLALQKSPHEQSKKTEILLEIIEKISPYVEAYEGARLELSRCFEELGDIDQTIKLLSDYKGINISNLHKLVIILSKNHRYPEATKLLKKLESEDRARRHSTYLEYAICFNRQFMNTPDLNERQKRSLALKAVDHFHTSIELGGRHWPSGWAGLAHLCDDLSKNAILRSRDISKLPRGISHARSWTQAAAMANFIAKSQCTSEHARMQARCPNPIPLHTSYRRGRY